MESELFRKLFRSREYIMRRDRIRPPINRRKRGPRALQLRASMHQPRQTRNAKNAHRNRREADVVELDLDLDYRVFLRNMILLC